MTIKIPLFKSNCRQCRASISKNGQTCPMCGLARPNADELNSLEKQYLVSTPSLPPQHHHILQTIDVDDSLPSNFLHELGSHLADIGHQPFLLAFTTSTILGGIMMLMQIAFPLSFMLFWAGMVYLGYDLVVLMYAVMNAFLLARLQTKRGLAPYSVHFKLELQLEKLLLSLRSVIGSLLERDWAEGGPTLETSRESFSKAITVLVERIQKHAQISLKTAAVIWRNNVYAILAMNTTPQEKVLAIGNKIREAEALLLRHRWLMGFDGLLSEAEEILAGLMSAKELRQQNPNLAARFLLTSFGPLAEGLDANFEHVPFDLPFKGRHAWQERLPPFPLANDGSFSNEDQVQDLFESIKQVRQLQTHLQDQMVINCVTTAVSSVSALEDGYSTTLEAEEILRTSVYAKFLDIPKFQSSSQEFQDEVDRLAAEARVALGAENGMQED